MATSIREAKAPRPASDAEKQSPEPVRFTTEGGYVDLFPGTGVPADQVRLENLQSYIYTGEPGAPVPDRLKEDLGEDFQYSNLAEAIQAGEMVDPSLPERPTGPLPEIVTMDQVPQFEQFIIDSEFDGRDPRMRNPHDEVMALPESHFRQLYDQQWQSGEPVWFDLDPAQKQEFMKGVRSYEFERITYEIENQRKMLEDFGNEARRQAKQTEAAEAKIKELYRKDTEAKLKARSAALDDLSKLTKEMAEATAATPEIQMAGDPDAIAAHNAYLRELADKIIRTRRTAGKEERAGAPGSEVGDASHLPPMTPEIAKQAREKFGTDFMAAAQWVVDQGYNPRKSTEGSKQGESQPAGFQEEPSA